MPKKTRQEKILARLRRLEQEKSLPVEQTTQPVEKIQLSKSEPVSKPTSLSSSKTAALVDYSYVTRDLRKTLILTALFLLVEIILSLTLPNFHIF